MLVPPSVPPSFKRWQYSLAPHIPPEQHGSPSAPQVAPPEELPDELPAPPLLPPLLPLLPPLPLPLPLPPPLLLPENELPELELEHDEHAATANAAATSHKP
jgi:hypothetical protein